MVLVLRKWQKSLHISHFMQDGQMHGQYMQWRKKYTLKNRQSEKLKGW